MRNFIAKKARKSTKLILIEKVSSRILERNSRKKVFAKVNNLRNVLLFKGVAAMWQIGTFFGGIYEKKM